MYKTYTCHRTSYGSNLKSLWFTRSESVWAILCALLFMIAPCGICRAEALMAVVKGNIEYLPLKMYPGECGVRAVTEGNVSPDGFRIDVPADPDGKVEILRSVEMNDKKYGVTEVSWGAFEGCHVGELRVPSCITEIGTLAFARAKGDMSVSGSVDVIGHYAFAGASGSLKIDEGVRYIYDNAFGGFTPDGGDRWKDIIVLPSTIESVGRNIFGTSLGGSADASIDTIQCHAIEPPLVETGVDGDCDLFENAASYRRVVLCVPDGSIESYRSAPGWCKFADIRPLSEAGIESVIAEADIRIGVRPGMCVIISSDPRPIPVKVYSPDGRQVYFGHDREIPLKAGLYVVRAATNTAKIAIQ